MTTLFEMIAIKMNEKTRIVTKGNQWTYNRFIDIISMRLLKP